MVDFTQFKILDFYTTLTSLFVNIKQIHKEIFTSKKQSSFRLFKFQSLFNLIVAHMVKIRFIFWLFLRQQKVWWI